MAENNQAAKAVVHEKENVSIYWLLPIVALLIAGWLVYKNVVEGDLEVTIHFNSASGLIEGKTEIKYQGMTMGVIDSYYLDQSDMKGIIATARIKRLAEPLLTDQSSLWLVKPEVNISGITGLDTLVSGNYVEYFYRPGDSLRTFYALDKIPVIPKQDEGLELTLMSDRLGSVFRGAPISYKQLHVGEVVDYQLDESNSRVAITAYIEPEYVDLVKTSSRFWESSGINFSGDLSGFNLRVDSMASLLVGGISFDTPERLSNSEPVQDHHSFELFSGFDEAHTGILIDVKFETAKGLKEGISKVNYKGITVGRVIAINVSKDLDGMVATISMDPRTEPILTTSARFWMPSAKFSLDEVSGLDSIIGGGIIEMDFALDGESKREFVALKQAPEIGLDEPGLHLTLVTDSIGSIERGTHILYRNIPIGSVQGFDFSEDHKTVNIRTFIEPKYQDLVQKNSRFWNAGGLQVEGGLQGFEIRTPSLRTLVAGGIELYTPKTGLTANVKSGTKFMLHDDYDSAHSEGVSISIAFKDGDGLQSGTQVKYLGISVGAVTSVELNPKMDGVIAEVELFSFAEKLARSGSQFWMVKPQFGLAKSENLSTLVTGKFISVRPGSGTTAFEFEGLLSEPVLEGKDKGLNLVLVTDQLGSLKQGVKLLYRGIAVGEVTSYALSDKANEVFIYANVESKYAPLIRENTVFWNTSGIGFDFSLFGGAKLKTSSIESILEGGIAFATPPESSMGNPAKQGVHYPLYTEPKDEWLTWKPKITLNK